MKHFFLVFSLCVSFGAWGMEQPKAYDSFASSAKELLKKYKLDHQKQSILSYLKKGQLVLSKGIAIKVNEGNNFFYFVFRQEKNEIIIDKKECTSLNSIPIACDFSLNLEENHKNDHTISNNVLDAKKPSAKNPLFSSEVVTRRLILNPKEKQLRPNKKSPTSNTDINDRNISNNVVNSKKISAKNSFFDCLYKNADTFNPYNENRYSEKRRVVKNYTPLEKKSDYSGTSRKSFVAWFTRCPGLIESDVGLFENFNTKHYPIDFQHLIRNKIVSTKFPTKDNKHKFGPIRERLIYI